MAIITYNDADTAYDYAGVSYDGETITPFRQGPSIQELLSPQIILPGIDKRLKDEIFADVENELETVRQAERAAVIDLAIALFMED